MARVLILGAGFAGLWSAIGAARKRDELDLDAAELEILVVDRNPYHSIRVRNYEPVLDGLTVPLADVLDPIGVHHLTAEVQSIDVAERYVIISTPLGEERLVYDRLVVTLGSEVSRPEIPGLVANTFDVDTWAAAARLETNLAGLAADRRPGHDVVIVVGAGFTGIEVAAEMPRRLTHVLSKPGRTILLDERPVVGAPLGEAARPVIREALTALGIETRLGVGVVSISPSDVTLTSGETIETRTVIWCAGMRASPLAASLPSACDRLGRVIVDDFMRVPGTAGLFAAGDAATSLIDGINQTIMSCQYARPMGRFAGHNVVADLFGRALLSLRIDWYVTVLDLGPWGALYTTGRDRKVITAGPATKATKTAINRIRVYPPRTGIRDDILAAAEPIVQAPPPEAQKVLEA